MSAFAIHPVGVEDFLVHEVHDAGGLIALFRGETVEESLARAALFVSALEPQVVSCQRCDSSGVIYSQTQDARGWFRSHEHPCPTCKGKRLLL